MKRALIRMFGCVISAVGLCTILLIGNANATLVRCVDASSSITVYPSSGGSGTYIYTGSSEEIELMSMCSATSGSSGSTATNIIRDGYYGAGTSYCWCRLVRPWVSLWLFGKQMTSGSVCETECGTFCASFFNAANAPFKTTI